MKNTNISRSTISSRLNLIKQLGLVNEKTISKEKYYSINLELVDKIVGGV